MKQLNKLRMKRFYLTLCFLMSVIGSAWGQETVTETFVVAPTTTDEVNAYISNGAKSDDNLVSIQFNTESDNSKKNHEEVIVPNFKLNVQTKNDVRTLRTIVVKPTNGVTITNVKLYGVDAKRNLVVNDTDIEETTSEHTQITPEGDTGNWWVQYSESSTSDITFSPTLKSDLAARNAYIYKVEVTYSYTKTLTPTDNTIDVVDLNYISNRSANNGLDRALPDFILNFEGGDGCKYNSPSMQIRKASGKMTVRLTDDNIAAGVKMTKIVFTGTVTTGLTASVGTIDAANGTWTSAEGVTEVTFTSTTSDATDLTFTSMVITTNDTPNNIGNKITPVFTLASDNISAVLDPENREVNSPALTTTPSTFAVEYYIEDDLYNTGTTIDKTTGLITMGTKSGEVKFKVSYNGKKNVDGSWKSNTFYTQASTYFTLTITEPAKEYPWTVSDNTLTIVSKGGGKVPGGMSTADDSMDDIPGLNVTLTGDAFNRWEIWGTAYGKINPTLNGNIPQDGTYIVLEPTLSGTVTIKTRTYDNHTYTLVDANGNVIKSETPGDNSNGYLFNATLNAGTKYYYYISGNDYNLGFSSITYELTQETTTFNVPDFNYERGAQGIAGVGLNREIGGFTFTFNPNNSQFVKANGYQNFFFRVNKSGTLVIAPDANNSGAKITQVVLKGSFANATELGSTLTASATEGSCETAIDIANGTLTVTCAGTSAVNITTEALSNAFTVSSIEVTTDRDVTFEKITPTITFDSSEISYAVGSASFVNGLTVTPANFRLAYSITSNGTGSTIKEYTESAGDGVAGTVTIGATAGTETVTAAFAGNDFYNPVEATYTLKVQEETGDVAGKTWDFTTWSTTDITIVDGDDSTWEYNSNGYHKNKTGTSQGKTDFGLAVMEGLLFTTTGSDQIRIYPNNEGQTDGSIRLQSKSAKIYMPELKAGQTITLTMMTASASSARGMVFSGAGADKVQLIYGAETSKTMNVVTYRVTEDISAEELIMSASTGGLYLYSIKLGYSELYWMDGSSNPVTDVAVTASGETSYKLNSTVGVEYTITDANGNASTDVEVVNGKVNVNTFTLGKTHTITATVDGHNATLTLRMVNTAEISYDVTTAEGTLGFSFVEPVLTKNPAGLNVVKWKSSNPEVATVVAETGEVTFVSAGTTIITAYIEENNYYAYQKASYTLTVNEKPEMVEPWTLSLVEAGDASVAKGSTGHKLTMTAAGTIKAGQVTNAIPGLTLSFGRAGDSDWTVAQENDHFNGLYVADADTVTLAKDSYLPTGGAYLGLEPTVNGVLSLHAAYYRLQGVVVVDKETNTVVAERRVTDDNHYDDYEFTVPLLADRTYYVYNIGNGKKDAEYQKYDMPVNAITFTPVFLDRIGHVIVKNNEYNITGAQLADDIHDYPTFSNVHAEEGGSVHYHSYQADGETENTIIYLDEDGNLVIDGEGTAILEAHVSHTNTSGDACHSVAKCTVTYTKSQLKFSKSSYTNVDVNQLAGFEEPTLNYIPESGVTYNISGTGAAIEEDGNITALDEGTNVTVTATIADNLYYTSSASYTITTIEGTVPLTITSEITLPVGTRGYDLLTNGLVTVNLTEADLKLLSSDSSNPENFYDPHYIDRRDKFYWKGITSNSNYASTDPAIAYVNNSYRVDAKTTGTVTLRLRTNRMYLWDKDKKNITKNYAETYFEIKVNVVPEEVTDEYLNDATYRTWNFHNGFDATELSSYDNDYTALGNSTDEAENFITHIPSGHDFWIYDSENNTLKSNTLMTVEDNKIDRNTVAFIANEPMNNLSLTSTATNCFASSKGTIDVFRASKPTSTYDYESTDSLDDKNVLTFYTFRKANNNWEGASNLNQVSDITFNAQTNMCGITGVDKDEHVTPYRSIQLSGKAAFIRVNDIKPGMWMSVIADNNLNKGVGFVQLASDGADVQAMGQSLYSSYSDSKDADLTKYPYNRVTNVFPYLQSAGKTVAIENESAPSITNIMVGYPAGMGTLNVGGGEKSPKINNIQRTYGYATFVSPYNIDLTGQTALKAYICDYYGTENNLVHMVQIKHIPANTPVMLKGYARDMFVLYISEGNKDVDHGISEDVFAKNRLVGALEDGVMVQPTEEGLAPGGGVTTWHNLGLTQNKFLTFTVASPIAKGRAYLRITQEEYEDLYAAHVSATAASTSAKIVFEDSDFDYSADEKPTGIEEVETNKSTMGNGYYYNLNGVRINGKPTQKGIYILNGKKIVVR